MVQKENRVDRAAENISCISSDGEVACSVEAQESILKAALELGLESLDIS
jgi:hypothetical protein